MRWLCCVMVLVLLAAGCAKPKPVVVPTPPPKPRPVKKEPAPPPPLLLPRIGLEDEDRLREEARSRVEGAEQLVRQLDQKRLAGEQQETYLTIQSFLFKAREAFSTEDFFRAFNLADKAQVLAQELLRMVR